MQSNQTIEGEIIMLVLITIVTIMATFTTSQIIASRNERKALENAMDAIRKEENARFIKLLETI